MVSTVKTLITYKGIEISYNRQVVYVDSVPHTTTQLDENNLKIIKREYERIIKEKLNRKYFVAKYSNMIKLFFVYNINTENNTAILFSHDKDNTLVDVYNDYFVGIEDLLDNNSDFKSNIAEISEIEYSILYNDIIRYADTKKDYLKNLTAKYIKE